MAWFEAFHPVDTDSGQTRWEEMYGKNANWNEKIIAANGVEVWDMADDIDTSKREEEKREKLAKLQIERNGKEKKENEIAPPPGTDDIEAAFMWFPPKYRAPESSESQVARTEAAGDTTKT